MDDDAKIARLLPKIENALSLSRRRRGPDYGPAFTEDEVRETAAENWRKRREVVARANGFGKQVDVGYHEWREELGVLGAGAHVRLIYGPQRMQTVAEAQRVEAGAFEPSGLELRPYPGASRPKAAAPARTSAEARRRCAESGRSRRLQGRGGALGTTVRGRQACNAGA